MEPVAGAAPPDRAAERLLVDLYARWYALPPMSARRHVDRLRLQCADELAQRRDDSSGASEALIKLAAALKQLFGLPQLVRDDIARLEQAVASPALRLQTVRPGLPAARLPAERIEALVALLRTDDPPGTAFGRLEYANGRLPETWNDALSHLTAGWDRLPAPLQNAVSQTRETLEAQLAGEAAVSWKLVDARTLSAYRTALTELERQPALLRVVWAQLLKGKLPLGAAQPTYLQAKTITSTKPTAIASAAGPLPASSTPPAPGFFTDVRFPAQVAAREEQPLIVRLMLERPQDSRALAELLVPFADPEQPEQMEIILGAPGFSERLDRWSRTILVYSGRDSEPAIFLLRAPDEPGIRRLVVDFRHRGKLIGSIAFETTVGERTAPSAGAAVLTGATDLTLAPRAVTEPPDLELRVVQDSERNVLSFLLHSQRSEVGYHWKPVGEVRLVSAKPQELVRRKFDQLNLLALQPVEAGSAESAARAREEIARIGEELYEELFPAELKRHYWERIRALNESGIVRSLLITSDETWIPWELVKPYHQDEYSDLLVSDSHLAERFQICHWLAGRSPFETATIRAAGVIVPDASLKSAGAEGDFVAALAERGVQIGPPLRAKDEVLETIRRGEVQLLHFATHAAFDPEHPDESPITLLDGVLEPSELGSAVVKNLRGVKPVIFLNACESAQIAYKLTGVGGWASKLVRDVRAAAFLGTLWQVNDELAAVFAKAFYRHLAAGRLLGEACHLARQEVRTAQEGNPTWLAYVLYGDPNSRIEVGG